MNWPQSEDADVLAKGVLHYLPHAQGRDVELRVTLLRARDFAAALRGRTDGYLASTLATYAHEIAGQFVYCESETEARLDMVAVLCRKLVGAAMAADGLHSEESPL